MNDVINMIWLQRYGEMMLIIITSVIASSGFWAYAQRRLEKRDSIKEMLIGLAHDRIIYVGLCYIDRGDWITQEEYENLHDYLYRPYMRLGGNGSVIRVMTEIEKLKIVKNEIFPIRRSEK